MEKRRCRKERVAGMTLFDIPFSTFLPLSIYFQPLETDEYKAEERLWARILYLAAA